MRDPPVVDDEGKPFEQRHAAGFEGRKPQRSRQPKFVVREQRERKLESRDDLALVGRVLGRETEKMVDAERPQLLEVIAKRTRLRRAPARPGNAERSTVLPSVACKGTDGSRAPDRWLAAPSSAGAGMVDQSGAARLSFSGLRSGRPH